MAFISDIEYQTGLTKKYISDKNNANTNALLIQTTKESSNISQSGINYGIIKQYSSQNNNSNACDIKLLYDAIINKKLKNYLLLSDKKSFSRINDSELKAHTYFKRIYNLFYIDTPISNISFLEFYKLNKDELNDANINSKYIFYDSTSMSDSMKNIILKFNNSTRESIDTFLSDCVNVAVDDIIDILDTDYYIESEFDNYSTTLMVTLSLLLDYLVSTDNKKVIYKLFDKLHTISNKKNKYFYNQVYGTIVKTNKPIILYTNNPKLMYYYLNFYRIKYKGRFLRKLLKYNILDLFLMDIKLFNNTTVNLTKYMSKFEAFFNKYKGAHTYSLSTFIQADAIISNAKSNIVLDIIEQNMDILYTMAIDSISNTSSFVSYYWRSDHKAYTVNDIDIFDSFKKISSNNNKRFWEIIENLLLNFKFTYKQKLKVLKLLKENGVKGFDEFATNAPFELQPLICEIYIS